MEEVIARLMQAIRGTERFEDAATCALEAILAEARSDLGASRYRDRARILRGTVHLRPGDAYQRLATLEAADLGATSPDDPRPPPADVPSATAWRWMVERDCAISIDVNLGIIQPHRPEHRPLAEAADATGTFDSKESQQSFLSRGVTHLLALPLRRPGRAVEGMITVEADCTAGLGKDVLWDAGGPTLQLLADVASPYLTGLPARPNVAPRPDEFLPVIGASMATLVEILGVFSRQEETILIGGPTGVGKSRLARWCHAQSPRRAGAFECLDLVTVPEELQMAELFGWRRGAFSGAVSDNPGCLARAEGGTLFIDEIDKLSLKAQAGLLHLLEERSYRCLGDKFGDKRADVRFMVGTNAQLQEAVRWGRFREDLYYRINVLPVRLPSLAERRDEIPSWAGFMATRRHQVGPAALSTEAERLLQARDWPGNLRQLDNIVRRAYALAMMDYTEAPEELTLTAAHFERALGYESEEGPHSAIRLLQLAAEALIGKAEQAAARGEPIDLELTEAFRGFVLGAAATRLGNREDAYRLFGKQALTANRNHYKAYRREMDRVLALCRALGHPDVPAFAELEDEK